jgi:hypothetical protein
MPHQLTPCEGGGNEGVTNLASLLTAPLPPGGTPLDAINAMGLQDHPPPPLPSSSTAPHSYTCARLTENLAFPARTPASPL